MYIPARHICLFMTLHMNELIVTLIAATNRREDLDAALLSRFNLTIRFDLPDEETRKAVFQRYIFPFLYFQRIFTSFNLFVFR